MKIMMLEFNAENGDKPTLVKEFDSFREALTMKSEAPKLTDRPDSWDIVIQDDKGEYFWVNSSGYPVEIYVQELVQPVPASG